MIDCKVNTTHETQHNSKDCGKLPINEAVKPLKKALYEPSLKRALEAPLIPRILGSTAMRNLSVSNG